MEEKFYTTGESADILGNSAYCIVKMYRRNELKGFTHPLHHVHIRILASSLRNYLKREGYLENQCFINDRKSAWKKHGFNPVS